MKTTRLTPAEANMVANLLESNTSTQETKRDERVRQSLWAKCREIQYLARKRALTDPTRRRAQEGLDGSNTTTHGAMMGLDTSHGCWQGAYSAFMRWRGKLCEVAGYGDIMKRDGFAGIPFEGVPGVPWPSVESDPLVALLCHSDCDGELAPEICGPIADRLEQLMPALEKIGDLGGHIGDFGTKTRTFIAGLRRAAAAGEPVDFH